MKGLEKLPVGLPGFQLLGARLEEGGKLAYATGLSALHKSHLAAALSAVLARGAIFVLPDEPAAARAAQELEAFLGEGRALLYPVRDLVLRPAEGVSHEYEHQRIRALSALAGEGAAVVVASAEAALQLTLPPGRLAAHTLALDGSFPGGPEGLCAFLAGAGYAHSQQVEGPGQFARRGGIVDFFPTGGGPSGGDPVRVEFWGDEVDAIAPFKTDTQRRGAPIGRVVIPPAVEGCPGPGLEGRLQKALGQLAEGSPARAWLQEELGRLQEGGGLSIPDRLLPLLWEQPATLLDYAGGPMLFVSDLIGCREALADLERQQREDLEIYLEEGVAFRGCERFSGDFGDLCTALRRQGGLLMDTFARTLPGLALDELVEFSAIQTAGWSGELPPLLEELEDLSARGYSAVVLVPTEKGAQTLAGDLQEKGINAAAVEQLPARLSARTVYVGEGGLGAGLEYPAIRVAVISHQRGAAAPPKRRRRAAGDAVKALSDLAPGDYVVHAAHGIGVFEGIVKKEVGGVVKDYIRIRYAGGDVLFVPVTQLDLVSKYIGRSEEGGLRLNRLNSGDWQKTKQRVKKAAAQMAGELIALYAQRMAAKGFAFSEDCDWQSDFERRFPYEETEDQLRCVREIKQDMQAPRPMDRLLCGDVGFGKTEVAIRAAFKCVMDSKQCAVLVPTTILAWQHFNTFRQRMEGFPIRIELLSRFRSARQQAEILQQLRRGEVDILIGTHRLLQKDVQFKDLGLCIIDEEQRFGVAHKEHFKALRSSVDVLTLSATPIPRTLNMAMSGIRDMSLIEEAPVDRHPVQTYVVEHDWALVTAAIRRELRRGGQVFYLHNRVDSIDRCAATLQQLLPDARIVTAHGKMGEEALSAVWQKLVDHEVDILVCTTIIETGVDVPNCNTLIIEHADAMGLSQLYQLRGRVGRSARRAFAYFTFDRQRVLSEVAAKRLEAIREFTAFGSGFRIAMRDLEIRGAGNILGAQQHGYMEAVGYEMYLRLLSEAVSEQQGKPPRATAECMVDVQVGAHIPDGYIPDLSQRLDIYKRIAAIASEEDAQDVLDELIDRFGDPPRAVLGLVDVALLRGQAAVLGIQEISQRGENMLFFPERFDPAVASAVASRLKGRVMVSMGKRPYIQLKAKKGDSPLDTLREALEAMAPAPPAP